MTLFWKKFLKEGKVALTQRACLNLSSKRNNREDAPKIFHFSILQKLLKFTITRNTSLTHIAIFTIETYICYRN